MFLHADSEYSDQTGQMSLCWAHRSFCWFVVRRFNLHMKASLITLFCTASKTYIKSVLFRTSAQYMRRAS